MPGVKIRAYETGSKEKMIAKLRVAEPAAVYRTDEGPAFTIPVALPEMDEIRRLALALHAQNRVYAGEMWGWPVSYEPESAEPPLDSKMTFTPAFFFIGIWPLWYISFSWDSGRDVEPSLLMGDEFVVPPAAQAERVI